MFSDFSLIYHNNEVYFDGGFKPAGTIACMALGLKKETVIMLEELYREQKRTGDCHKLREGLYALPCVTCAADLLPEDCANIFDELICFRVYMRHFLQKYISQGNYASIWTEYLEDLDRIAAQLKSVDNLTRTVLHPDFEEVSISFREKGGELCECVNAGIGSLLLYDLLRALESGHAPKKCPCCGSWFMPSKGNEVYCSGTAPGSGGKACRELGASRSFTRRTAESKPMQLCRSACGRIYNRKSRGKLDEQEAAGLTALCRELRDKAINGEISIDELESQLAEIC